MFDVNIAIMKMEFEQSPPNLDDCREKYSELGFIWDYIEGRLERIEEMELMIRADLGDTANE